MTDDKRYNGWTNYETWLVNLWMDNSEGDQSYWAEQAHDAWNNSEPGRYDWQTREAQATRALADSLKDWHEEMASEQVGNASVFSDLIGAALGNVNWQEIAEHLISDVDHDEQEAA